MSIVAYMKIILLAILATSAFKNYSIEFKSVNFLLRLFLLDFFDEIGRTLDANSDRRLIFGSTCVSQLCKESSEFSLKNLLGLLGFALLEMAYRFFEWNSFTMEALEVPNVLRRLA
ncbi:unnamed protein product [Dracunculus medinensis]|uniref:Secreted protein n=1 Tax=Dracunculus medinensis TaxID=318479 RepID=A0A0N4URR2_DRAME|nr:unnamed protein product [Dracunculus medinensis]